MSTKRKLPTKLAQPMVKPSVQRITKEALDESRTVVTGGGLPEKLQQNGMGGAIEISSGSDGEEEEEEEEEDEDEDEDELDMLDVESEEHNGQSREIPDTMPAATESTTAPISAMVKRTGSRAAARSGEADREMTDVTAQDQEEEEEDDQPTFGDLVRATTSTDPIDVAAAFPPIDKDLPISRLTPPSGTSLSTVLTQALKTNDTQLLESCLSTTDLPTVRLTIQRLASPLASSLLSSLAARLHRRPGRAGSLMVWVQWTLVAHGGYLATQPELVRQLAGLNKVIDERARSLQSLLQLKGKLDMLEAQGQLRRNMMALSRRQDEDEDDERVVYVEGEESASEDEAAPLTNGVTSRRSKQAQKSTRDPEAEASESEDEMPTTVNGAEVSDPEDEDEDEDGDELIDDEASESDNDTDGDEEDVDHDDEDEMDEEDESDDAAPARAAPPTKLQKTGGLFSKRR